MFAPDLAPIVPPPTVTGPITVVLMWVLGAGVLASGVGLGVCAKRFMHARDHGEVDRNAAQVGVVLGAVLTMLSAAEIVLALTMVIY
jgi:hypothetical protein